jgi:hypothetical protein
MEKNSQNYENENKFKLVEKHRFFYFDQKGELVKLSNMKKNDSNNVFVTETRGCLVEIPLSKLITEKKENKIIFNNEDHPLKATNLKLIKFIIKEIISYLPAKYMIFTNTILNRSLLDLCHFELISKKFEHVGNFHGADNTNHIYTEFDMCEVMEKDMPIFDIEINLQTKDQGWASAPSSSSWVDLIFTNGKAEIKTYAIAKNYRERDYKHVKLVLSNLKGAKCDLKLFNYFNDVGTNVKVVARSQYPGWSIYLKSFSIEFRLLKIKRD